MHHLSKHRAPPTRPSLVFCRGAKQTPSSKRTGEGAVSGGPVSAAPRVSSNSIEAACQAAAGQQGEAAAPVGQNAAAFAPTPAYVPSAVQTGAGAFDRVSQLELEASLPGAPSPPLILVRSGLRKLHTHL